MFHFPTDRRYRMRRRLRNASRRLREAQILGWVEDGWLQIGIFVPGVAGLVLFFASFPGIYADDAELPPPGATASAILFWCGVGLIAVAVILILELLRRSWNDRHSTSSW